MHFLITGHTGFKGSWLGMLLKMQGHEVSGISLEPNVKSLYLEANLQSIFKVDGRCDIRDRSSLKSIVEKIQPDVVIHFAAQALVRESYKSPILTFETNVLGTLNVLDSIKDLECIKAALIITTDKVYINVNKPVGYVESDPLGGDDPYSASKAAADIATQSWAKIHEKFPIAIARAGNVVGAGDWSQDRLIPDLISAYIADRSPILRYPGSVRPWQHVLDCLNGYMAIINHQLISGDGGVWNIGPELSPDKTVGLVADLFAKQISPNVQWRMDERTQPHEAGILLLNSDRARTALKWKDKLNFEETLGWTIEGYLEILKGESSRKIIERQINQFLSL